MVRTRYPLIIDIYLVVIRHFQTNNEGTKGLGFMNEKLSRLILKIHINI